MRSNHSDLTDKTNRSANAAAAPKRGGVKRITVQCRERLGGVLKFYYRAAA